MNVDRPTPDLTEADSGTGQTGDDQRAETGLVRRLGDVLTGPVTASVVVSIVIGGIVIAIAGRDPFTSYPSMITGSLTGRGLSDTFGRAIPIVGMGLALAFAFRAGVFNLGAEGQMVLGALAGALVAINMPGPGPLVVVLACLTAIVVGGLWGLLSGLLETTLGVPILISSLLLNYPARYFSSYLVRFPLRDTGSSMVATRQVPISARIPALTPPQSGLGRWLSETLGSDNMLVLIGRNVNWSLVVVVALLIAVVVFWGRTASGYEAEMAGLNIAFARYGGVNTKAMTLRVMFVSGGMSGLVGVMLVLGSQYRVIDGALVGTNYAWTGLLVALLAASRPLGVLVAGFFFAVLVVGGEAMQRSNDVSSQIAQVIQATVIILLTWRFTIGRRRRSGRTDRAGSATPVAADEEVGRV